MKLFEYTAVDGRGATVHGQADAESVLLLDRSLEDRGLVVTHVKVVERKPPRLSSTRLSKDELVVFTTQVSTMLGAGVPILQGLKELKKRLRTERARSVVNRLIEDLEGGTSLAQAMSLQPRAFPDIYRASVGAGELAGELPAVLKRMGGFLEWSRAVRAMTIQALVYPFVLCLAIVGLIVLLLTFLLPRIITMFPGGKEQLPRETRMVMAASDLLTQHVGLWIGTIVTLGILVAVLRRRRGVQIVVGRVLLGIPRLGTVARMLATSRFASTAHTLHHSGCDVFQTLRVAGSACGNAYMVRCFERVADRVRAGSTITEGMAKEPLMDPMLVQVTAVGEQSGELDQALQHLVEYYDQEVPRAVKWFLSLFEPALLVCAAVAVAVILMACLMPIFSLYENL